MKWCVTTGIFALIVNIFLFFFEVISKELFAVFFVLIFLYLGFGFLMSDWDGDDEDAKEIAKKEVCKVLYSDNGGSLKFCHKK